MRSLDGLPVHMNGRLDDVFERRQMIEQIEMLEDHANARADATSRTGLISPAAKNPNFPAVC